jgi:hypothetical protein
MADLSITAANVLYASGEKSAGTAGASVTAGQALYLDSATGTLKLAQCDGTAAEADVKGIALNSAGTGQPVVYAVNGSAINIGATTSKATVYVLSATAGGVAPLADLASGNKIVHLGYATATDGSFVVKLTNTGASV